MNELELVRELRAEVSIPTPAHLARGRERLLVAIAATQPRRQTRFRVVAIAGVTATVAAGAALLLAGLAKRPVTPGARITLAAQVLREAAVRAAARSETPPRASQWIYTKVVSYSLGTGRSSSESWLRFDGRDTAYLQDGQLIVHQSPTAPQHGDSAVARFLSDSTPATAYRALASLPRRPERLLAYVAAHVKSPRIAGSGWDPARGHTARAQLQFGFLADLLWNSAEVAPPRAEAAAFHAMAAIAGVRARRQATDVLGRPAIALSIAGVDQQLLLDRSTYSVIGARTLSNGSWPAPKRAERSSNATVPKGRVVESLAWARVALVNRPGRR
jgi:hypothetical protein